MTTTTKPGLSVYVRNECQGSTLISDTVNNIVCVWDDQGENYYYFRDNFNWFALECPVRPGITAACTWGHRPITKIETAIAYLLLNN